MSAPLDTDSSISSVLAAAQVGTWEWERRTNRVTWSPEIEQIFSLSPGSFDGTYQRFITHVHPDDRQKLSAAIAKAVEDQTACRIEHRIIMQDGAVRWVVCRGHTLFRDKEPATGMAGTIEDITVRKDSELAKQDIRYRLEA